MHNYTLFFDRNVRVNADREKERRIFGYNIIDEVNFNTLHFINKFSFETSEIKKCKLTIFNFKTDKEKNIHMTNAKQIFMKSSETIEIRKLSDALFLLYPSNLNVI